MSSQTTNYKLIIPEGQDNADISVVGENMEIIDAQLKKINDEKLAKTGGDLSGRLNFNNMSDFFAFLKGRIAADGKNYFASFGVGSSGALVMERYAASGTEFKPEEVDGRLELSAVRAGKKDALIIRSDNGGGEIFRIYGEHNKPTAADVGAVPAINANSASFNMDNVIKSGAHLAMYITGNNTLGTPQKYGKTTLVSAAILSYGNEADYGVQVAFLSGGGVMTRGLSKGVLSEWTAFYHEGNAAAIVADATLEE